MLADREFLEKQLAAYERSFRDLSQLDRRRYRAPRAQTLKACLEMAIYLADARERQYFSLFEEHLREARRAKLAVRWYLANFVLEVEATLQQQIRERPEWAALIDLYK